MEENYFQFFQQYYNETDGLATGSQRQQYWQKRVSNVGNKQIHPI
jgi:hypothetical protein